MRSSTAGAYVVIAFKGTQLDWITMKGTTGAIADIYVDGSATKAATVNLYASPAVYQQNLWTTGTLPDGYHTVKIVRSHRERLRQLPHHRRRGGGRHPRRSAARRGERRLRPFTWNPAFTSWTTGTTTSASGGTYKYINTAGAYVTFNFTGVGFKLIAKTAPSYGNLTVTIDGVAKTVSLYSSATTYKKMVFTEFLHPGHAHRQDQPGRGPRAVRPRATPSTSTPSICSGWRRDKEDGRRPQLERASAAASCRQRTLPYTPDLQTQRYALIRREQLQDGFPNLVRRFESYRGH